nr:MAG TPA: hypothetical protein [Bacteriophage sp.]
MRYFNEDRTQELELKDIDLGNGRLEPSTMMRHVQAVAGQEAKGYFDQSNGGVYVQTQPCIEAVEEHDELEEVMVYIPYTAEEKAALESSKEAEEIQSLIADREGYLKSTDYMAIKCAERGLSIQTEYPEEYAQRQNARDEINDLREQLKEVQ